MRQELYVKKHYFFKELNLLSVEKILMKIVPISLIIFYRKSPDGEAVSLWMQKRGKDLQNDELSGQWEFPGGKIDHGESPLLAIKREVEEEVGIQITLSEKFIPSFFKISSVDYPKKTAILNIFFSSHYKIPEKKGRWFSVSRKGNILEGEGKMIKANLVFIKEFAEYIFNQVDSGFGEQVWNQ